MMLSIELHLHTIHNLVVKSVNRSRKNWSKKLDDALWAYRTAYKNPMGMSPYKWFMEKHVTYLLN